MSLKNTHVRERAFPSADASRQKRFLLIFCMLELIIGFVIYNPLFSGKLASTGTLRTTRITPLRYQQLTNLSRVIGEIQRELARVKRKYVRKVPAE